jgi:integrase
MLEVGQYQASGKTRGTHIGILLREMNSDGLLSEISKNDISKFITGCRLKNRNPATINRYLAALSAIVSRARDYWDFNVPKFKVMQFRQKEPVENIKYFENINEIERIAAAAAPHLQPIIWTAIYTGLRLGRLLSLKWNQVDFENT